MQNLAWGGFSALQLGQRGENAVPHDMQKRARSGFSAPQLGHFAPIQAQRYAAPRAAMREFCH